MDTKEWFKQEREKILKMKEDYGLSGWDNLKTSEIYIDKDDKTLQWEICVILRKVEQDNEV